MTSGNAKTRFCPRCFRVFPEDARNCPEHGVELVDLPREASLIGEDLDNKYEIVKRIGRGGMGTVYHARQKLIGRDVAVKVLRPEFAQDVQAIQRFFTEVRAACQLESRNCVTVHDFGLSQEGHLYYTMELLHGRPLTRLLKEGPLEPDHTMRIGIDICHAVEEAHDKGIVHRDLKPDNVMLVRDKEGSLAKVLDFGIAKLLTEEDGNSLTQTGMVCGTPEYMSPEQARGDPLGFASDIYSIGIILYEMLAGLPPFQAPSPIRVLLKHINEQPRSLSVASPDVEVPVDLERYLLRMLAKDPAQRPESAAAVRLAFEQILAGKGVPVTTSLPELVSSSDGVRRVTVPLRREDDLATRDTDAISLTRPESQGSSQEPPEKGTSVMLTPTDPADEEPGANTLAVVRSIQGGHRRLWLGIGALFALAVLGIIAVAIHPDKTTDSGTTQESLGLFESEETHSTQWDATDSKPASASSPEFAVQEAGGEDPISRQKPEVMNDSAVPSTSVVDSISTEIRMDRPPRDAEAVTPHNATSDATGDTATETTETSSEPLGDSGETTRIESVASTSLIETALRHQSRREYDLAIQKLEEAKKHGGDPAQCDQLILQCQRLKTSAQ